MRILSRWLTAATTTALLTGSGGVALAQEPTSGDEEVAVPAADDYTYDDEADDDVDALPTGFGTSIQIGGGVTGFIDDAADAVLGTGGNWTARLVLGTRFPVAVEAAYIGTANDISALGLDDDALAVSHGFEGAVRWNIVSTFLDRMNVGSVFVDPYVFGGIAYKNYSLANEDFNTSSVGDSDNVGEIPVGGGIALSMGRFIVDARGEYRAAFSDDLLGNDTNALSNWGVSGRLGWEF